MNKDKYKYCGIYLIKIDKYRYVGQSIDIKNRINQHKRKLKQGKHANNYMQNVYNKYQTFEYVILHKCEEVYLTILEQTYINMLSEDIKLNLTGAKVFSKEHREAISKANSISEANLKSLAKAVEVARLKLRTEAQIANSKKSVKTMNTKEANAKSAQSRKSNLNVINARRKREDKTVYIFVNKRTNKKWKGLRVNFAKYLNVNNASARVSEILIGKSFRGWKLSSECNFTFVSPTKSKSIKGIDSASADTTTYSFIHSKTNEEFVGTRYNFAEYIEVSSKQLSGLIHMRDKTYHKWRLNCCSLKGQCPV